MSSVILTHDTSTEIQCIPNDRFEGCRLTITVIFDKTYTIRFHEHIPRDTGTGYNRVTIVEKDRYIRDIPYFPNAILDAIKMLRLPSRHDHETRGYNCSNGLRFHTINRKNLPPEPPSPGDEIFNGLSKIFSGEFRSDIKSEEFTQEFTKLKLEHEKIQIELIDAHNRTQTELTSVMSELKKVQTELKHAYDNTRSIRFELYDVKNQKNDIHQSLENKLQENEKLSDDLKTSDGLVAELRGKNERLIGLINEEKLKNLSLSNKLSDITDLYESILTTTINNQRIV